MLRLLAWQWAEGLAGVFAFFAAWGFVRDRYIRGLLLDGVVAPRSEHVTHDVLLSDGVTLIEYLVNTSALVGPRTFLCAAPLLVPTADGAPTRAFAIEGLAS